MKLSNWSYTRIIFSALAQSALITILFRPWIQLAALHWQFSFTLGSLWVFMTALSSIFFVKRAIKKKKEGLIDIIFGLLIPMVMAALLRLNILVFIPLTLILFLLGIRFNDYPLQARFGRDWALGSMLLIIFSSLEGILGFKVPLFSVLLFFALGIGSMILWNAVVLEKSGLRPDYKDLGNSIIIFIVVVGGISLGLGLLFSPAFFAVFVSVLHKIYLFLAELLVLLLVRPLAWLLSPLFRWVENLELKEQKLEILDEEHLNGEHLNNFTAELSPQAMKAITGIGWFVFIAIFLLVLWLIVRKLLRQPTKEKANQIQETRESVFSGVEILRDFKSVLKSILRPISRLGQTRWYKGDNPLMLIRTMYARFVVKNRKKTPFLKGNTPLEYEKTLWGVDSELNPEALRTLTELYNLARYGDIGDQEAVKAADKASRELH